MNLYLKCFFCVIMNRKLNLYIITVIHYIQFKLIKLKKNYCNKKNYSSDLDLSVLLIYCILSLILRVIKFTLRKPNDLRALGLNDFYLE